MLGEFSLKGGPSERLAHAVRWPHHCIRNRSSFHGCRRRQHRSILGELGKVKVSDHGQKLNHSRLDVGVLDVDIAADCSRFRRSWILCLRKSVVMAFVPRRKTSLLGASWRPARTMLRRHSWRFPAKAVIAYASKEF